MADPRLNALLVFGNDAIKKAVREMVAKLDRPPPKPAARSMSTTWKTPMPPRWPRCWTGLSRVLLLSHPVNRRPYRLLTAARSRLPRQSSNSLVIMASIADYNNLVQVIKKLDRRSKQVFVQVLIAEVSLDNNRETGPADRCHRRRCYQQYLAVAGVYDPQGAITPFSAVWAARQPLPC